MNIIGIGYLPPDVLVIAIGSSCGAIALFYIIVSKFGKKKK